jgi:hypothetical protein
MINGMCAFGIKNGTCSSLLTDGGSAFEACPDINNFQHILCTYHFALNVFTTTSKMSSDMKHWYLQLCGDLVFHHFDNKTGWYSKWNDLKAKFQNFPVNCPISPNCMKNAKKLVQLLLNDASQLIAKVCRDLGPLIP